MKKLNIVVWSTVLSLSIFCPSVVNAEKNIENSIDIKQEFVQEHPEIIPLENYLKEAEKLYEDLKNKYIWAKKERIKPAQEGRSLDISALADEESMEKAFKKLPWGGWSREWSKKLIALTDKLKVVETSSSESIKLKREIRFILDSLFILRSNYEPALDGEKVDINYSRDSIDEALQKSRKILSLETVVAREKESAVSGKELTVIFDLNKGAINNFKMGDSIDSNALIKSIGEKPSKEDLSSWSDFYYYYNNGFYFSLKGEDKKKDKISSVEIYLEDSENPYSDEYYKKFQGETIPLTKNENKNTIRQKFGSDYEAISSSSWRYRKPYGYLNFVFNESGNLDTIAMFYRE